MTKPKRNPDSRALRICAAFLLSAALLASPLRTSASWPGDYVESVKSFIQEMHIEGKTDEQLTVDALKGMFSGLDDYSAFMDREETKAYEESLSGQFSGIGVSLDSTLSKEGIVISSVFSESPAEAAGLQDGDILTKADEKSLVGLSGADAAKLIRGVAGTAVTLQVKRGVRVFPVVVVRGEIRIDTVTSRRDGQVGYLRITQFSDSTVAGVETALEAFRKAGVKKIILDLRDNPGGYVGSAVDVARKLLPPGRIVSLDYRSEQMQDVHYSTSSPDPGWLIAVLVNENTASAAEILAGAIQDAENGYLIGKKTFGKGVVQSMFMLLTPEAYKKYGDQYQDTLVTDLEWSSYHGVAVRTDELLGLAKITSGSYLTRNGRAIHKVGLIPTSAAENRVSVNDVDISLVDPVSFTTVLKEGEYAQAVRQAESILKAGGYFKGIPDRQFGKDTSDALKMYQKALKIKVSGLLDSRTDDALNGTLASLRLRNDPQYKLAQSTLGFFGNR